MQPVAERPRRPALVVLVLLLVASLAACDRLPGAAADLAVGDCFDEPDQTTDISEVQRQPCGEPHDAEVFAVLNNPAPADQPFPVLSGFDDFIEAECVPLFESYTGTAHGAQSDLEFGWFQPTLQGWRSGDREFTCYLVAADGGKLTGSRRR